MVGYENYPYDAKRRVDALVSTLKTVLQRDPNQEVQGIAVPVLDACLNDIKKAAPDDPVVASVVRLVSEDQIGMAKPVRAADMLLIAEQLQAALGDPLPGIG